MIQETSYGSPLVLSMGMYVFTSMLGLAIALLGGAGADYFKTAFLTVGLCLFI
eukprot:SAG22_NODE_5698_length_969_cov_13.397701_2_plen_53_part_00